MLYSYRATLRMKACYHPPPPPLIFYRPVINWSGPALNYKLVFTSFNPHSGQDSKTHLNGLTLSLPSTELRKRNTNTNITTCLISESFMPTERVSSGYNLNLTDVSEDQLPVCYSVTVTYPQQSTLLYSTINWDIHYKIYTLDKEKKLKWYSFEVNKMENITLPLLYE